MLTLKRSGVYIIKKWANFHLPGMMKSNQKLLATQSTSGTIATSYVTVSYVINDMLTCDIAYDVFVILNTLLVGSEVLVMPWEQNIRNMSVGEHKGRDKFYTAWWRVDIIKLVILIIAGYCSSISSGSFQHLTAILFGPHLISSAMILTAYFNCLSKTWYDKLVTSSLFGTHVKWRNGAKVEVRPYNQKIKDGGFVNNTCCVCTNLRSVKKVRSIRTRHDDDTTCAKSKNR